MTGIPVLRTLAAGVWFAALVTGVAMATDGPPDVVGAPTVLKLDLTGAVPSRCGIASTSATSADLGNIGQSGDYDLSFTLDCNAKFDIRISSQFGGLTHVGTDPAPSGFGTLLDYDVALSVTTDLGTVGGECAASALTGCGLGGGVSSGDGVAIGTNGQLALHWTAPAGKLLAGKYQDSIVITVEART